MLQVDDPVILRAEIARLKSIIDIQEERIHQLSEALIPPQWTPPAEIGLTPQEARMLAILYKANGQVVTKESILFGLYHDHRDDVPDIKIVDVYICKLRKKVTDYGIEVHTAWGRGYLIDAVGVGILNDWGIDPNETLSN